jgi:hypothetical protein
MLLTTVKAIKQRLSQKINFFLINDVLKDKNFRIIIKYCGVILFVTLPAIHGNSQQLPKKFSIKKYF